MQFCVTVSQPLYNSHMGTVVRTVGTAIFEVAFGSKIACTVIRAVQNSFCNNNVPLLGRHRSKYSRVAVVWLFLTPLGLVQRLDLCWRG
jgi:hypothetical protein